MEQYLTELRMKYDKNREHCGFITFDGVVEVDNIAVDAMHYFEISKQDADTYLEDCNATWHTHIHAISNLSIEDLVLFQGIRNCHHFIVSSESIWLYYTDTNGVVTVEERFNV